MIIAPLKQFLIDYKINNPSDSATYYVRAVIKNSVTGVTLATLNLTDNGNKYYSYLWQTPGDPSGTGTQIAVFLTVYTDSGYTTESTIYGTTLTNYVVRDLQTSRTGGGGFTTQLFGGAARGGNIDYDQIERIIRRVVKEIDIPKPEPVNLASIERAVREAAKEVISNASDQSVFTDEQDEAREKRMLESLSKGMTAIADKVSAIGEAMTTGKEMDQDRVNQIGDLIDELKESFESASKGLDDGPLAAKVDVFLNDISRKVDEVLNQPIQVDLTEHYVGTRNKPKKLKNAQKVVPAVDEEDEPEPEEDNGRKQTLDELLQTGRGRP